MLFKKLYPEHRREEIENCIVRAAEFIEKIQATDGSWYGSWGVCFTYAGWFGIKGLIAAGRTYEDCSSISKACDFLLSKELASGGWGESYLSCQNKEYSNLKDNRPHIVNTAWAMLALLGAGQVLVLTWMTCGKDWDFGGGDHGDAGNNKLFAIDLAQALALLKESGKICVPLVVFGHMHKQLAYGKGLRKMIVVGADNTIYLNAAIVPRVKRLNDEQGSSKESCVNNEPGLSTLESCGTIRALTLVEILDGRVDKIVETWVSVVGDRTKLEEEHILFRSGS
ncbi:hypothetical protein ACLB2K_009125 [Fragaria x ananassa]